MELTFLLEETLNSTTKKKTLIYQKMVSDAEMKQQGMEIKSAEDG